MIKRSRRQQRQTILYTCSHHLFPTRCSIEVAKLDDSIAVVTLDKQTRRSWRQRVSIFLLSTLIQKYYYDLELLWNLLTKGVLFNGTDVEFSTQHIHTYPHAVTHDGNAAQLIWQTTKRSVDGDFWFIEALTENQYPFTLELSIRITAAATYRYACRVVPSAVMHLFEWHCLEAYAPPCRFPTDSMGNYPEVPNHVLQVIVDDLYYDPDSDSFRVRFLEVSSLEAYLTVSVQKNNIESREQQKRVETDTESEGDECIVAADSDSDASEPDHDALEHSGEGTYADHALAPVINGGASEDHIDQAGEHDHRRLSHSGLELVQQIRITHNLDRRPPAMDRARTDTELDDLASQVISELDHPLAAEEGSSALQAEEGGSDEDERDEQHSSSSSAPMESGAGRPANPTILVRSRAGLSQARATEDLERSAAMVALLQRMKDRTEVSARLTINRGGPRNGDGHDARDSEQVSEADEDHIPADKKGDLDEDSGYSWSEEEDDEEELPVRRGLEAEEKFPRQADADDSASIASSTSASAPFNKPALKSRPSERTAMREGMMKKFAQSKFATFPDRTAEIKAKLDRVVAESKHLVKKAHMEKTLQLMNPAKAFDDRAKSAGATDFQLVENAISVKAAFRSRQSTQVITDMLRYGCGLSPFLVQCSSNNILRLSAMAELLELTPSERRMEALHVHGEPILSIYIILKGTLEITDYPVSRRESTGGEMTAPNATTRGVGRKRTVGPGECLGENVLQGEHNWRIDIGSPTTSPVTLCALSLDAALRFIGRRGSDVDGAMVLFWKHHRLWQEIKQYNQDLLRHSMFSQQVRATGGKKRHEIQLDVTPMNVIDSGRIKVYQPGMEVFIQGEPREYLYLVLRGCCEFRRSFPPDLVKEGLMPPSVEVGLVLMCGDFSFMDGEDHLWIEQLQDEDHKIAGVEEEKHVRDQRRRKYVRFDVHKNSLVAVSRVEVALVPINEIAKCMNLFVRLIRLATAMYPAPFIPSEELVRRHYEGEKWKAERGGVLKEIIQDREDRMLNECWYQAVDSHSSDARYQSRKPGYRVGKLDQSLASAARSSNSSRAGQETSRSGVRAAGSKASSSDGRQCKDGSVAEERDLLVLSATQDLHTPRRLLLANYFKQFERRGSEKMTGSGKFPSFDADGGWDSTSGKMQSARSIPSGSTKTSSFSPVRKATGDGGLSEKRGPPDDRHEHAAPEVTIMLEMPQSRFVAPTAAARPSSAPSHSRKSPRPHSAAEVSSSSRPGVNGAGGVQPARPATAHNASGKTTRPSSAAAAAGRQEVRRQSPTARTSAPDSQAHPTKPTIGATGQVTQPRPSTAGSARSSSGKPSALRPHSAGVAYRPHSAGLPDRSNDHSDHAKTRTEGKKVSLNFVVDESFLEDFHGEAAKFPPLSPPRADAEVAQNRAGNPLVVPALPLRVPIRVETSSPPTALGGALRKSQQPLDPEHFVEMYREKINGDPKQRFRNEFVKQTF